MMVFPWASAYKNFWVQLNKSSTDKRECKSFSANNRVFPCISVEAVKPNCVQKGYDKFTLMVLLHSSLARVRCASGRNQKNFFYDVKSSAALQELQVI